MWPRRPRGAPEVDPRAHPSARAAGQTDVADLLGAQVARLGEVHTFDAGSGKARAFEIRAGDMGAFQIGGFEVRLTRRTRRNLGHRAADLSPDPRTNLA